MPTRAQAGTTPPAQRGLLTAWRRHRRTALTALAATAALGAGASPASAAEWGYEQITPADSSSYGILGMGASKDMKTIVGTTRQAPLPGFASDGRGGNYGYGFPRGGAPWSMGPIDGSNYLQAVNYLRGIADDGSLALWNSGLPSVDGYNGGMYRVDRQYGAVNVSPGEATNNAYASTDDLRTQAYRSESDPGNPIKISTVGKAPVVVSVDNTGAQMTTQALGSSPYLLNSSGEAVTAAGLTSGALTADGSSVIFTSVDGIPGDNDGGAADIYRRILTPGAEQTIEISDATPGAGADPASIVHYRWATRDQQRVFFVTDEALEPGDTDGERDLYLRVGTGAPVRISQGETVNGSPTGNAHITTGSEQYGGGHPEWVLSSVDGNRTFFTTSERLTQDAPVDGAKLYERDVAEGRTRLVAGPLDAGDVAPDSGMTRGALVNTFYQDINFRGLRVTPYGAVFMSRAPFGGAPADGQLRVYVWTRDGDVEWIAQPEAGLPAAIPGQTTILPSNLTNNSERAPMKAGRAVSDDGSRVFFTTSTRLIAQDTDGGRDDVYVWSAADGGVRLVTPPGSAPYDAAYIDNSPDGSEVYFTTAETILPSDTDSNATDVYLAILGGGSATGKPAPDADPQVCAGDACRGPNAGPPAPPSIGSVGLGGFGNLPASPDAAPLSVGVSKVGAVTGSVATLKVKVSGGGRISVAGASLRPASLSAPKAGTYSVRIALSAAAKKSLKRKKTLKVSARVTYLADDGESVSKAVSMTFKQPKAKPAKTKKGGR